jgi:hypothetical protein
MRVLNKLFWVSHFVICFLVTLFFTQAVDIFHGPKTYPEHVHKTLYLDRTFNQEEVELIVEATYEWNAATEGRVSYDVVVLPAHRKIDVTQAIVVIKVTPDFPKIMLLDFANKNITLGYWEDGEGPIPYIAMVAGRSHDRSFKSVMLHEIGHSLGLKHNEGETGIGTLMYPTIDEGSDTITPFDVSKYCELRHCTKSQNK